MQGASLQCVGQRWGGGDGMCPELLCPPLPNNSMPMASNSPGATSETMHPCMCPKLYALVIILPNNFMTTWNSFKANSEKMQAVKQNTI